MTESHPGHFNLNLDHNNDHVECVNIIYTKSPPVFIQCSKSGASFRNKAITIDLTMLNLPVELQEQIVNYLSRQDLLALAQTCKSVGFVASARLRSIVPNLDPASFTRCIRVLMADSARAAEILELNIAKCEFTKERLSRCPHPPHARRSTFFATLKSTIRKSRSPPGIPLDDDTQPCDPPDPPLTPFDFSQALTNLTRLRKLVIHAPQNALLWTIPVEIATLREIYAHTGAESTPMLGWISYQRRINTLRVHCTGNKMREYRIHPPNSIFFPSLSFLTSNAEGAAILLPESVVEDLHIEGLEYSNMLPEGVPLLQGPSLVRAMKESHERTPLRRLTLTGDILGIFKWLKALAEGGVSISHIRMVLVGEIIDSIQILVRLKGWRYLPSSYHLLQEVEFACRGRNVTVVRSRNSRNFQCGPLPAAFRWQVRHRQ